MKKLLFLVLLFFSLPSMALAQEEDLPRIFISEASFVPEQNDTGWIELFSQETDDLSLKGFILQAGEYSIDLTYTISPEQYLVIPLKADISSLSLLSLVDAEGKEIDTVSLPDHLLAGSYSFMNGTPILSTIPTAGRPNLYEEPVENKAEPADDHSQQPEEIQYETAPLKVNEVYANPPTPEADYEFIELYNPTEYAVSLQGWTVQDKTKSFILTDHLIESGGYLVINRHESRIALNNTNEEVTLIDPFGTIIDHISYDTTTENYSHNYHLDESYAADPTPGGDNAPRQTADDESSGSETEPEPKSDEEQAGDNTDDVKEASNNEQEVKKEEEEAQPEQILLNEFMPNPEGSDLAEWIELYHAGTKEISLAGYIISDEAKDFALPDINFMPGEYLLLSRELTGIALNNGGDSLTLSYGDTVLDSVGYANSKEGVSWSRFGNAWEMSNPTPEEENQPLEQQEEDDDTSASILKKSTIATITLEEWDQVEKGQNLSIEGILTAEPGVFSKRTAYLQSLDGMQTVELYFHKAQWPQLTAGNLIRAAGEKSVTQNGSRLLIRNTDDLLFLEEKTPLALQPDDAEALKDFPPYSLITLNALLIAQEKDALLIDAFNQEVMVDLKKASIELAPLSLRQPVTITALLDHKPEGQVLYPLSAADIQGTPKFTLVETEAIPAEQTASEEAEPPVVPFALGSALLLGAGRKSVLTAVRPIVSFITNRLWI